MSAHPTQRVVTSVLSLTFVAAAAQTAAAQTCTPAWSDQFGGDGWLNSASQKSGPGDCTAIAAIATPAGADIYVAGPGIADVAGSGSDGIARFDGWEWHPLGSGVNNDVLCLAAFDDDGPGPHPTALYAGGRFTIAGGVTVNRVAKWNGASWEALGSGMNNWVHALLVFDDDGPGPHLPALYAAGLFTTAGGAPANRIAKWDGSTWSALGSGVNNRIYALAAHDEDGAGPGVAALFAGGEFTTAGGASASRVANWNGSAWSALGAGCNNDVLALASCDLGGGPALFAGGLFTTAGGGSAPRLARWSAGAWSSVASGAGLPNVNTLATWDGPSGRRLILGGQWTDFMGASSDAIAQYDGASIASLGGEGLELNDASFSSGVCNALAVIDEDGVGPRAPRLFAVGNFALASRFEVSGVAGWDGQGFTSLGRGLTGAGGVLLAFEDAAPGLFVGGEFVGAGGEVNFRFRSARFDGEGFAAMNNGFDNAVTAAALFDADGPGGGSPQLFALGLFTNNGAYVSRWTGAGWQPVGAGLPLPALAAAQYNGVGGPRLYASTFEPNVPSGGALAIANILGGDVTDPGPIVAWDGQSWTTVATLNGVVQDMVVFDDDGAGPHPESLFVTGSFTSIGGVSARNIARYDGAWHALTTGLNLPGVCLAVYDDGGGPALYVGGGFASAGGVTARRLAKWNGSAFSEVGAGGAGGAGSVVRALEVFDEDGPGLGTPCLFVGGDSGLLRWNGVAFASVGAFESGAVVLDLAVFQGSLYAVGEFGLVNGTPSQNIARWDPGWPFITQQPAATTVCAGGVASFTVALADTGASVPAYQWRRNGVPLSDGPTPSGGAVSGAASPALTISGVAPADAGLYACVVTTCASLNSTAAALTLAACPGDADCDGDIDQDDMDLVLFNFGTLQPPGTNGDVTGEGFVDQDDLDLVLFNFGAHCP